MHVYIYVYIYMYINVYVYYLYIYIYYLRVYVSSRYTEDYDLDFFLKCVLHLVTRVHIASIPDD